MSLVPDALTKLTRAQSDCDLGLLSISTQDNSCQVSITPTDIYSKIGDRFPYLVKGHAENLEMLVKRIQSNIPEAALKKIASSARHIHIVASADGTFFFKYEDVNGREKREKILTGDAVAKQLYADEDIAIKVSKSLERLNLLAEKFKNEESPVKSGAYRPNFIHHQTWWRMFTRVSGLLADPKLSPETAKSLKFFVIQYLMKVASIKQTNEMEHEFLATPMHGKEAQYHRTYKETIAGLKLLDKVLAARLGMKDNEAVSVSDAAGFTHALEKEENCCKINFSDTDEAIAEKLRAAKSYSKISTAILYELPAIKQEELTPEKQNQWKMFAERVEKIARGLGKFNKFHLVGIGTIGRHAFAVNPANYNVDGEEVISKIKELCSARGYTPSLQQTARLLADEIPLSELPTLAGIQPLKASDMSMRLGSRTVLSHADLLKSPTFTRFEAFAKEHADSNVGILADNICTSLRNFKGLDKAFKAANLTDFLLDSYARVLNAMESMIHQDLKGDTKAFLRLSNFNDLIFEEMISWLEFSGNDKQADETIQKVLHSHVQAGSKPDVCSLVNSGVRCATAIRNACLGGEKKPLRVLAFDDSYFEIMKAHEISGDKVTKVAQNNDTLHGVEANKAEDKFDLLFVDAEGAPQATGSTTSHDIVKVIDEALSGGLAKKPFTVVIDVTIGKINNEKIAHVLKKYKPQIESGELNIVCFRSIQKFDTFGSDKLSGGTIQVYSKNQKFVKACKEEFAKEERDVDPINRRGIAYIYEHCLKGVEKFREATFENADVLFRGIDKQFVAVSGKKPQDETIPFYIEDRENCENYCVMIRANDAKALNLFFNRMNKGKFPIIFRPSFGFSHAAITEVPATKSFRLSAGIEDKEMYKEFAKQFNDFAKNYSAAQKTVKSIVDSYDMPSSIKKSLSSYFLEQFLNKENMDMTTVFQPAIKQFLEANKDKFRTKTSLTRSDVEAFKL